MVETPGDQDEVAVAPEQRRDGGFFAGGGRGEAVAALAAAIGEGRGLVLLTGMAGLGTSTVLRAALAELDRRIVRVVALADPPAAGWGLRELTAGILGQPDGALTVDAAAAAFAALTQARDGEERIVLAVDDAHELSAQARDFLFLLRGRGTAPLVQLVLAGREAAPAQGWWDAAWWGGLPERAGAAAVWVALQPLAAAAARDYVAHGLARRAADDAVDVTEAGLAELVDAGAGAPARIDAILAAAAAIGVCRGTCILTEEEVQDAAASVEILPDLWPAGPAAPAREARAEPDETEAAADAGVDAHEDADMALAGPPARRWWLVGAAAGVACVLVAAQAGYVALSHRVHSVAAVAPAPVRPAAAPAVTGPDQIVDMLPGLAAPAPAMPVAVPSQTPGIGKAVTRMNGRLHSDPRGPLIRTVPKGTELTVFARATGGWYQVGDSAPWGWMHASVLDRR